MEGFTFAPKRTHDTIKCEAYKQLRELGLLVFAEYPIHIGGGVWIKADLAVFNDMRPWFLVECKRKGVEQERRERTRQFERYARVEELYEVKTYWIDGWKDIEPFVQKVRATLQAMREQAA